MAALWLLCRSGRRSAQLIRTAEVLALLVCVTAFALLGRYYILALLPGIPGGVAFTGLAGQVLGGLTTLLQTYFTATFAFAMTYFFAIHAAIVPSSAGRSFVTTLVMGLPLIALTAFDAYPFAGEPPVRHAGTQLRDPNLNLTQQSERLSPVAGPRSPEGSGAQSF